MSKSQPNRPAKQYKGSAAIANFDISEPLDITTGIKKYKGQKLKYFNKLAQLEVLTINRRMAEIE